MPNNKVCFAVADVGLTLCGDGLHHVLGENPRFRPFLTGGPSVATVDVVTTEVARDEAFLYTIYEARLDHGSVFYRTYGAEGMLDADAGTGWLRMTAEENIALAALENFLRVSFALLLVREGGFLFHSAGMVWNGSGYLFYGHSGSGKTTVARLSQGRATLLSDDLVALRSCDGVWRAYGTPFWGNFYDCPKTNASAPLRGLFGLVKSDRVKLELLPHAQAVADVVSSVPVTYKEPHLGAQLVGLCADLVAQVPCYRLQFTPDDSFWSALDELA